MIFASTFSGFGGSDIGAHRAGLSPIWGIEYADDIASVARSNGLPTRTADVLTTDWASMEAPDWYHASPPCPSFSVAKSDNGETEADLDLARSVLRSVEIMRPAFFSLENVRGYIHSVSLRLILDGLEAAGYTTRHDVLCAADYGTPQTRHRLFLVASRDGVPRLPTPTHAENPAPPGLFGFSAPRWVSWYEAVEDLLSVLPTAELAPWQRKRLPAEWCALLYGSGTWSVPTAERSPAPTVTANQSQAALRAVLIDGDNATKEGPIHRANGAAAPTVSGRSRPAALLVDGKANNYASSITVLDGGRPASTVLSSVSPLRDGKALLTAPHVRTVRLSPRCLARWQDFPDSYALPTSSTLACRGIGNAVPARMMEAVIRANK